MSLDELLTDTAVLTAVCDTCPDWQRTARGPAAIREALADAEDHAAAGHAVSAELGDDGEVLDWPPKVQLGPVCPDCQYRQGSRGHERECGTEGAPS